MGYTVLKQSYIILNAIISRFLLNNCKSVCIFMLNNNLFFTISVEWLIKIHIKQ